MVSNKKYMHALEKWNEWENIATKVVKENCALLKEMKEINDLSKRINDNNMCFTLNQIYGGSQDESIDQRL